MTRQPASKTTTNGTARIDVDHPAVAAWATRGLAVLAGVAFLVGAPSLIAVGQWAGLGWAAYGLPVVVDLGLVIGAVSATVARQRRAPAGLLWAGTALLVAISTWAQGVHAWSAATVDGPARWVAIALGALPPLAVLWSTEAFIRLVVSEPVGRPTRTAEPAPLSAGRAQTTPAAAVPPAAGGVVPAAREQPPGSAARPAPTTPKTTPAPAGNRAEIITEAHHLIAAGQSTRATADTLGIPKSTLTRWLATTPDEDQMAA